MTRIVSVFLAVATAAPAFALCDVNAYAITPSPSAVMITFANGPDSRGFSWQTDTSVTESEVRLVAGAASLADFETTPLVYTGSYVPVVDTNRGTTPLANCHKVIIKNLQPGTAYSYRLGGGGRYVYGRTDVKPRTSNTFTIVNLNDAQMKDPTKIAYWENSLSASVRAVGGSSCVDFIINGGDLFDQNLKVNNVLITVPIKWGIVLDPVFALYNGVPFVSSSGNHDYREYGTRMPIEYPTNLTGCESLDYGNVHIATIPNAGSDAYSGYVNYLTWLEADLAANVARGASTWRIVCVHFGPYTTGDHAQTSGGKDLAKRLGGICASNKVDLVLQAHDHTFSKTLPYRWRGQGWTTSTNDATAINLTPATREHAGETWDENPEGTYYLSCGSAGHRVGEGTEYASLNGTHPYTARTPVIAIGKIAVSSKWGNVGAPASSDLGRSMFGVLRIDGNHLSYDFYMIDSDDGSHVLYDKLRILKQTGPAGPGGLRGNIAVARPFEVAVRPVEGDATAVLQKAFDDCFRAGGGTVTVEKGEYAVKGLRLRSGTTLLLKSGAVLKASRECGDYDILADDKVEPVPAADFAPGIVWVAPAKRKTNDHLLKCASRWNNGIIRILRAQDVRIIGEPDSVIDGCDSYDPLGEELFRGVHGISVHDSTNCAFSGYTIRNTGNWAHNVWRSADLRFEKLTILGGHDGIHFSTCDRVKIADCTMKTGDDCVAGFDNEDVTVRGCSLNTACSAFRFGGRRVLVEDCRAWGPGEYTHRNSLPTADRISGSHGKPGVGRRTLLALFTYYSDFTIKVRHDPGEITVRNCRVENAQRFLHYNFSGNETWQKNRPLRSIVFDNVTATGLNLSLCAYGDKDAPFSLALKNCRIAFAKPQREMIRAAHVESLALEGVSVEGVDGPCVRSWGDVAKPFANDLKGVVPDVVPAAEPFKVRPI